MTTLRMVVAPTQPSAALSDKSLAGLPLDATASQTLIELKSDSAAYELIHDRRWSVMLERPDLTVLRFVDHGDLIAQCNIASPPALPKGEQLSMAGFQEDVKRVLGKNFEEMVEATEEVGDNALRVLRVVVAGKIGELTRSSGPIITSPTSRAAALLIRLYGRIRYGWRNTLGSTANCSAISTLPNPSSRPQPKPNPPQYRQRTATRSAKRPRRSAAAPAANFPAEWPQNRSIRARNESARKCSNRF